MAAAVCVPSACNRMHAMVLHGHCCCWCTTPLAQRLATRTHNLPCLGPGAGMLERCLRATGLAVRMEDVWR